MRYLLREGVEAENAWEQIEEVAFFAMPPNRKTAGMVPIYGIVKDGKLNLQRGSADANKPISPPLFFAESSREKESLVLSALYEDQDSSGGRHYSINPQPDDKTLHRAAEPICWVWRNPMAALILDRQARPEK